MVEINRPPGFSLRESGLLVPEKRGISAEELPVIFGKDVRLATQQELIALGILPKGSELRFLESPIIHAYNIRDGNGKMIEIVSGSQYFLDTVEGGHGVLASYLPPYSSTSEHEHGDPITETYKQIAGSSLVHVGRDLVVLSADKDFVNVPLNTEHQVLTGKDPAFMLIIMWNAGSVPRDQWHKPTNRLRI